MALFIKEYSIVSDSVEKLNEYVKLMDENGHNNINYVDYVIHEDYYPCPQLTIRCTPKTFSNIAFLLGLEKDMVWF